MLTINSKDRTITSTSSSNFVLQNIWETEIKGFYPEYISLPFSFYNISSSYNSIRVSGVTISVTAGQYSATSLATALQAALIAGMVDATYTCTYSTITGKFTIARTGNFTLDLNSSLFLMKRQLGFNGTSQLSGAATYTSDSFANLQNSNSISVHSNVFGKALDNAMTDGKGEVMFSVPIDKLPGEIIVYKPDPGIKYYFRQPLSLTERVTFYLRDINNNAVDLNGCDWEMRLVLF